MGEKERREGKKSRGREEMEVREKEKGGRAMCCYYN